MKPVISEQAIQKAVVAHLRARGVPGLFAFHVPNGGYRRPHEAAIFAGLGVVPGVPDLILIDQGKTYALELKRLCAKPSAAQETAMKAMERAGATVAHAQGLDAALAQLEAWGLLRGSAV